MAEIVVSYSHTDRDRAREIVAALRGEGFDVFFDEQISIGHGFDAELENKLRRAKAVVVLWSVDSVSRPWVREEAHFAERLGNLVPVIIDGCRPPLGLALVQAANLSFWQRGEADHQDWSLLTQALVDRGANRLRTKTARAPRKNPDQLGLFDAADFDPWSMLKNSLAELSRGPPEDIEHFKRSANAGETYAQYVLGLLHLFGVGVTTDVDCAVQWLEMANERGWRAAAFALGVVHERRLVPQTSARSARAHYKRAAIRGCPDAARALETLDARVAKAG